MWGLSRRSSVPISSVCSACTVHHHGHGTKGKGTVTKYHYRFENRSHLDAKLVLVELAPKEEDRPRLVELKLQPRGSQEVTMTSTEVMCWGGFRHGPELYERFCAGASLEWEPGRTMTVGYEELGNRKNSWWSDIRIAGARKVPKEVKEERDYEASFDVTAMPSADFFLSSKLDTTYATGEDSCNTELYRSECSYSSEETSTWASECELTAYRKGQRVMVKSSHVGSGGWAQGTVVKVQPDGTVRVKFQGSFQKDVPLDRQDALLRVIDEI